MTILPVNLSQETEFLVAERDEVTLLHKPEELQMVGREGQRLPVISFKDTVVAECSRQVFRLSPKYSFPLLLNTILHFLLVTYHTPSQCM